MKLFKWLLIEEMTEQDSFSPVASDKDATAMQRRLKAAIDMERRGYPGSTERLESLRKAMAIQIPATEKKKGAKFENPVFISGGIDQWSGHPDDFTGWTPQMKPKYEQMKAILHKFGIPPMDTMYYANRPWYSFKRKGGSRGVPNALARNFVLTADGGNFIWRRYDSGSDYGGSDTTVYVKGVKHPAEDLLVASDAAAKNILGPIARQFPPGVSTRVRNKKERQQNG